MIFFSFVNSTYVNNSSWIIVKSLPDKHYPSFQCAVCHLDPGSDVLGLDTIQSYDRDSGSKVRSIN